MISRESVRLEFLATTLNDLKILVGNIQNAYLNVPTKERVYILCDSEFGSYMDRPVLIVKALYSFKSSGDGLIDHLAQSLFDVGSKSCLTDLDFRIRTNTKPDVFKYFK